MQTIRSCMAVMVSVLANALVAGCASTAPAASSSSQDIDQKKVGQVESAARRAGVEVHWINYPRKPDQ